MLCCRNYLKSMQSLQNLRRLNLLALKANSWAVKRCRFMMILMNFTKSSHSWHMIHLILRMSYVFSI